MCVKEVKWDLEQADGARRATVLIVAQGLRLTISAAGRLPTGLFDRPLDYSRSDLLTLYEALEGTRNQAVQERQRLQQGLSQLGAAMPDYALDHSKTANRGLEVWMSTLGAGILPDVRDEVRTIWEFLSGSRAHIPEALRRLNIIERDMAETTGQADHFSYGELSAADWLEVTAFVPQSLRPSLNLR